MRRNSRAEALLSILLIASETKETSTPRTINNLLRTLKTRTTLMDNNHLKEGTEGLKKDTTITTTNKVTLLREVGTSTKEDLKMMGITNPQDQETEATLVLTTAGQTQTGTPTLTDLHKWADTKGLITPVHQAIIIQEEEWSSRSTTIRRTSRLQ